MKTPVLSAGTVEQHDTCAREGMWLTGPQGKKGGGQPESIGHSFTPFTRKGNSPPSCPFPIQRGTTSGWPPP